LESPLLNIKPWTRIGRRARGPLGKRGREGQRPVVVEGGGRGEGGLVDGEAKEGRGEVKGAARTSICWASILRGKPSTTPLAVLRRTL